jgi:transposase
LVTGQCGLGQYCRATRPHTSGAVLNTGKKGAPVPHLSADPFEHDIAEAVGPSPTNRGKQGTKHHLVVDARGTPLAAVLSGANINDHLVLEKVIDAIVPVRSGKPGRPRFRPDKVHADKGYDFEVCRRVLKERGIEARIARRGIDDGKRLGCWRWVVERTHAWLHRFRRLSVRYEQRDDIHQAFLSLGCALVCLKQHHRFC